jgi:hypothetical protein
MAADGFTSVMALAIPGALLIAFILWAGVRRGARALDLPPERRTSLLVRTATLLGAWLVLAFWLGANGVYRATTESALPAVLLAIAAALPIVIGLAIVATSRTARDILAVTPAHLLIGVQTYRILGAVFLVLLAQGRVPGAFANPAGWGDLLVGVSAPIVAALYRSDAAKWRGLAVFWNVFGLADLHVAVAMGILTAPGDLQRLAFDTPNSLIASFPLVLIPTVMVPISIVFHVLALRLLRREPNAVTRHGVAQERAA